MPSVNLCEAAYIICSIPVQQPLKGRGGSAMICGMRPGQNRYKSGKEMLRLRALPVFCRIIRSQ